MNLADLLPPGEDGARRFLTWQLEAIESPAKYLGLVGGVGSGKTLPACILGLALSMQIPGNRGIVLRRTYQKLHDSTWATFLEVLERSGIPDIKYSESWGGFYHRVRLPNRSEIVARESKDKGRYLGPEYGWFLLDEALEEPVDTFKGLMTRLRHAPGKRYLKGIIATNPPPRKSWFVDYFGLKPGIKEVREPVTGVLTKYHLIRSTTRENPHLPLGYLGDLLANNPDSEISRIVDGHFGFTQEGVCVFPGFRIARHVRDDCFKPHTPIIRGWDFGFHHPACTWHQIWCCKMREMHWSVHHELDGAEIEALDFIPRVLADTTICFPGLSRLMILDGGDRAGAYVSDKGPGPIVRAAGPPWYMRIRNRACPIEPGLELIRKYLSKDCRCGLPGMTVDSSCVNVIEAFLGGYHYSSPSAGRRQDNPVKDHFFDDFVDSVRYVGENFVRMEEKGRGFIEQIMSNAAGVSELADRNDGEWLTQGASWLNGYDPL